jgi:ADP-dependent NAD(P)H-hydrate dehydratase / NAD(P)H-hydrate epimerase
VTALLTAAEMRAVEARAMAAGRATGAGLMERAGQGVVAALFARFPALAMAPMRAMVLCGPGNNGGDGYVIARRLAEWGWQVQVRLLGDPSALPADAQGMADRWAALGETLPLDGLTARCWTVRPPTSSSTRSSAPG